MIPSESLAFFSQKFLRVGKRAVSLILFLHFSMPWTTINLYCFTLKISEYAGNDKFHINVIEWHAQGRNLKVIIKDFCHLFSVGGVSLGLLLVPCESIIDLMAVDL